MNEALSVEFDNHQVRLLAGVGTDAVPLGQVSESEVELALYNIKIEFDFVGNSRDAGYACAVDIRQNASQL
jgi:hypothetical protein